MSVYMSIHMSMHTSIHMSIHMSCAHVCAHVDAQAGFCLVCIKEGAEHVTGSPFSVPVLPGPPHAGSTVAYGAGRHAWLCAWLCACLRDMSTHKGGSPMWQASTRLMAC